MVAIWFRLHLKVVQAVARLSTDCCRYRASGSFRPIADNQVTDCSSPLRSKVPFSSGQTNPRLRSI
jgi:hypothetical protein